MSRIAESFSDLRMGRKNRGELEQWFKWKDWRAKKKKLSDDIDSILIKGRKVIKEYYLHLFSWTLKCLIIKDLIKKMKISVMCIFFFKQNFKNTSIAPGFPQPHGQGLKLYKMHFVQWNDSKPLVIEYMEDKLSLFFLSFFMKEMEAELG